jgi:NAD(P)H-hydrate repair Nnr-like enzyme with NAD(P)H-hydrate dehydratase domain
MKAAPTQIIDGETVYENTTGNAALATAGTGDVLTGMITSLLAQLMNLLVLQFCVIFTD